MMQPSIFKTPKDPCIKEYMAYKYKDLSSASKLQNIKKLYTFWLCAWVFVFFSFIEVHPVWNPHGPLVTSLKLVLTTWCLHDQLAYFWIANLPRRNFITILSKLDGKLWITLVSLSLVSLLFLGAKRFSYVAATVFNLELFLPHAIFKAH